ncbi:MAG TPA: biotin/lipoyl-containing protein [Anaerolineaceae bacterium]|nr:biotin/lipoyl-containing protein [Anaerolineaceae bacterium]
MSDYFVSINNHQYQIKIKGNRLIVDNQPVQNSLVELNGNGLHVLDQGQRSLEMHIHSKEVDSYEVLVGGRRFIVRVEPERQRKRRRYEDTPCGDLSAPMPGMVVNVLVQAGDYIHQGQTLVVLESMKMQMQLRSAIGGTVTKVMAKSGQQVTKDSLLVSVRAD